MFALTFSFPAGRYHATPWGRHVNEADVAWPPEPWRILRALVASYWRKGDRIRWSEDTLAQLIDALAEDAPIYHLPEGAIHAHTQHYMPAPIKTTLVFDAFAHLPEGEKIVAAWPKLDLDAELFGLAADLAEGIGYLGRAESWVDCEATSDWRGEINCRPIGQNGGTDEEVVRVLTPRSANDYAAERTRLLKEVNDAEDSRTAASGKRPPTSKALEKAQNKAFGPTLPERLADALTLDTADYQKYRWNRPPAAREVVYTRPPLSPVPRHVRPRRHAIDRSRLTLARYLLAGRPLPRIEDAIKIGELMRLAALSMFGWENGRPKAPSVISGRGPDNKPLRDGRHSHAFWLPEDADGDGWIDHISVYAEEGFDAEVREKLDRLTRLWIGRKDSGGEEGSEETGHQEWRLALEGFGRPEDFADTSRLFGCSAEWVSVTPFLAAGHLKKAGYEGEVNRLWKRRNILSDPNTGPVQVSRLPYIEFHGIRRQPVHFHRFRSRGREQQFDAQGALLRLSFPEPVEGPLALGYACHFGLGMFARPLP